MDSTTDSAATLEIHGYAAATHFLGRIQAVVGKSLSVLKLQVNIVPDQSITSSTCGWHCIKAIRDAEQAATMPMVSNPLKC